MWKYVTFMTGSVNNTYLDILTIISSNHPSKLNQTIVKSKRERENGGERKRREGREERNKITNGKGKEDFRARQNYFQVLALTRTSHMTWSNHLNF